MALRDHYYQSKNEPLLVPNAGNETPLPFLTIGRLHDQKILASVGDQSEVTITTFVKLLEASRYKLAPGKRLRLAWGEGSVCCQLDERGEILYSLVTASLDYPERLAFQLLNELQDSVRQRLSPEEVTNMTSLPHESVIISKMQDLLANYRDPRRADKLADLYTKTRLVKGATEQSIRNVLKNSEPISSLEIASQEMDMNGRQFQNNAQNLKKHFWWKNVSFMAGMGLAGVLFLVLGIWFFFYGNTANP